MQQRLWPRGLNMIHVTADGSVALKDLGQFLEPVEISDTNGKLIGLFVPANLERARQFTNGTESDEVMAEIERRAQANEDCFTTKQVFEHLLALTEDESERTHLRSLIAEQDARNRCLSP